MQAVERRTDAHLIEMRRRERQGRGAVGGMEHGRGDTGRPQPADDIQKIGQLLPRNGQVVHVGCSEVGIEAFDCQPGDSRHDAREGDRLIRQETKAVHARINLDVYGQHPPGGARRVREGLGHSQVMDGRRESQGHAAPRAGRQHRSHHQDRCGDARAA